MTKSLTSVKNFDVFHDSCARFTHAETATNLLYLVSMKNRATVIRNFLFVGTMLLVGMISSGILQDEAVGTAQNPASTFVQPSMPRIIIMEGVAQAPGNANSFLGRATSPYLSSPVPFGSR